MAIHRPTPILITVLLLLIAGCGEDSGVVDAHRSNPVNDAWTKAVVKGDVARMEELITNGQSPDEPVTTTVFWEEGFMYEGTLPPVVVATGKSQYDALRFLAEQGADLDARDSRDRPALSVAVEQNNQLAIELLLDLGANTERINGDGETPLVTAARFDHPTLGIRLLQAGADPDATATDGMTAAMYAAVNGHADLINELLSRGIELNVRDSRYRRTVLDYACVFARVDIIEMLLDARMDVNAKSPIAGRTPLVYAVGNPEGARAVQYLIDHGATLQRGRALFEACQSGTADIVWVLLQAGADINDSSTSGESPLMAAISNPYTAVELVQLLIENGASVNAQTSAENGAATPLIRATVFGHPDIVELLLDAGADATLQDSRENTAIDHAVARDDAVGDAIVKLLKESQSH